jgi:hypothetical protein
MYGVYQAPYPSSGHKNMLTASQVGLMHKNMESGQLSGYLVNNFCDVPAGYQEDNIITTPDAATGTRSIVWAGKRNLGGNLTVQNRAQLEIHCEIGIPRSVSNGGLVPS